LKAWATAAQLTFPGRASQRYADLRGNRLAGAASFYGFVSLFPLLLLGAAVASRIAGDAGVETVQKIVDENLPGLGIDVGTFHDNAGTIGAIGAALLLFTGLAWVDSMRAAVRSMWGLDDRPGSFVPRKALDAVALIGLGVLIATSWGLSVLLGELASNVFALAGFEGAVATVTLRAIAGILSIGVSAVMFAYLIAGLPRIPIPARVLLQASLFGAVVFEVLKQLLVVYAAGPASRSAYAAFAAPLLLLTWIYLVTRLLMFLAALTAEAAIDAPTSEADRTETPAPAVVRPTAAQGSTVLTPSAREARAVGLAAGAILGATAAGLATLAGRAVTALFRSTSRH
jgi:membrane protein